MSSTSTENHPADAAPIQLLVFDVSGRRYAVESRSVREIVGSPAATRIPGAPAWVRGLINLRGQLVIQVDLVHRLTGSPARSATGSTVVVESDERLLGLVVDDVHDVQALTLVGPEGLPYEQAGHGLLRGVGRSGDEVVLVIDVDEIVRQTLV
jgi:purine-binding chemotaxis protein CheW